MEVEMEKTEEQEREEAKRDTIRHRLRLFW